MRLARICFAPAITLEAEIRKKHFTTPEQWIPSFVYQDIYYPKNICSPGSVHKALHYHPTDTDIIIVTQMKSGTTWLQQIVFQILTQGQGDITDPEFGHIQNISPWLEADYGPDTSKAPRISNLHRIIKTHLPAGACPFNPTTRYLYLMRNPLTCLESILNHFHILSGPLTPPYQVIINWFCSNQMWWTPWPAHVGSWVRKQKDHENIMLLRFEDLKKNPKRAMSRIAAFLGQSLTMQSWKNILHKTSFSYMRRHELFFEMSPPNLFTGQGTFFKKGGTKATEFLNAESRRQIVDFCRQGMHIQGLSLENFYNPLEMMDL